jgi:hypothetical protein
MTLRLYKLGFLGRNISKKFLLQMRLRARLMMFAQFASKKSLRFLPKRATLDIGKY